MPKETVFRIKELPQQGDFWIPVSDLPQVEGNKFFDRLEEVLQALGFTKEVHQICAEFYRAGEGQGGRPPIDPVVYFKMVMVGFLENLPSERAIATRCADSLMVRQFLGYGLSEKTPDHSSLSVIRKRLSQEAFDQVFELILRGLRDFGLLRGKDLGIDSAFIEANASLSGLENRNTGEQYWEYVRKLAREAGVNADDPAAVARFDKSRPGRKTSNQEWVNPDEPDAKVAKDKSGATDMLHKVEHVVDLETGVIVQSQILPADQGDSQELTERIQTAVETVETYTNKPVKSVTADKGYFAAEEIERLQQEGLRTNIPDPQKDRRRMDQLSEQRAAAVKKAHRTTRTITGKRLSRSRGMHIERSFAHVLDAGGQRRTTLRGHRDIAKRTTVAAMTYNLCQLLYVLFKIGTVKQAIAGTKVVQARFFWFIFDRFSHLIQLFQYHATHPRSPHTSFTSQSIFRPSRYYTMPNTLSSA